MPVAENPKKKSSTSQQIEDAMNKLYTWGGSSISSSTGESISPVFTYSTNVANVQTYSMDNLT